MSQSKSIREYTIIRNLPSGVEEKPDGFLFASTDPISEELAKSVLQNPELRSYLPVDAQGNTLPVLALLHQKHPLQEYRMIISTLSYYTRTMTDNNRYDVVIFEDHPYAGTDLPKTHTAGTLYTLRYGPTLDDCNEMYRAVGCQECPKHGLECILLNVGYRPWIFRFAYNRKDKDSAGMIDGGVIDEKNKVVIQNELRGESTEVLLKKLAKLTVEGFKFIDPLETKVNTSAKMNLVLRPPRDHQFKEPLPKSKK